MIIRSQRTVLLLTVVFFLFLAFSCKSAEPKTVSDESKGDSYYQLGLAAWNQGDYIKAKREFAKAIEAAPKIAFYYNHLGMVYLQEDNYDKAKENFNKALKVDPKYSDPHNNLGVMYMKMAKFDEAIKEFDTVKDDPLYPFPHFVETNIGQVYRLQQRYAEAEKHYNIAIKMKGTHCEAYKELAVMYDVQGLHEKAADNYKKCIDYCQYHVEALYRGAVKMFTLKRNAEGEEFLRRCIEVEAKNLSEVTIPYLKDCTDLAEKMGITSEYQKNGNGKRQIEAD